MRVLVMGTGGLGGYYGNALAQGGHDVVFVARGGHLAAIRQHGLFDALYAVLKVRARAFGGVT